MHLEVGYNLDPEYGANGVHVLHMKEFHTIIIRIIVTVFSPWRMNEDFARAAVFVAAYNRFIVNIIVVMSKA